MPPVTVTRRAVVQGAASAAVGFATAAAAPSQAFGHADPRQAATVPPEPIPGGIAISDTEVIHVWSPGTPDLTLPFTGSTPGGLDVEPTTMRDFKGFSAVAYHVGRVTGDDGTPYDLETDMRAFQGAYVDGTGTRRFGTFAFI
jgi:hypothetical protein